MAQTHVVSALVTKRAELDGQIIAKQEEIKALKDVLHHIDRTIKVFSPEIDLRNIRARRSNKMNPVFAHGEVQRMVLNYMRCADGVVISREIADSIIKAKGVEVTVELLAQTQKNVLTVLRRLEHKGVVAVVDSPDGLLHWQIK